MMKMNALLNKVRVSTDLKDKVTKAIALLNQNDSGIIISEPEFIRMSVKNFVDKVLLEGLTLEFKPKK